MLLRPFPSRRWFAAVVVFIAAVTGPAAAVASERADAVFLVAYGRVPTPAEREHAGSEDLTPAALLAQHRQRIAADESLRASVAQRAHEDAFGVTAIGALPRPPGAVTYFEHVQAHLGALSADAASYAAVIGRAYDHVIQRDVYPEEITYWREFGEPLSFVLLVGAIEDWARRNQPGLMVTAGRPTLSINCPLVHTQRLSPDDARALREAVGMDPLSPESDGRHVLAPGGARLVSGGRIHQVVVGRGAASR